MNYCIQANRLTHIQLLFFKHGKTTANTIFCHEKISNRQRSLISTAGILENCWRFYWIHHLKQIKKAQRMSDSQTSSNHNIEVPSRSYELRILQCLRRIIRAVDIHSTKLATQYKITGPQLGCLLALSESGPITSARLAKQVYLSPSTIVGIIDRLEEKGLVQRKRDKKDRRLIHICITAAAEKLIAAAPSLLQDTLSRGLIKLPESEQIAITTALEKLVELMEAGDLGAAPILETGPLTPEK